MKKRYMAPTIEIAELETEALMIIASGETDKEGTGSGDAEGGPALSNRRRGRWGDLWAE